MTLIVHGALFGMTTQGRIDLRHSLEVVITSDHYQKSVIIHIPFGH
jgi:hypothetical protein